MRETLGGWLHPLARFACSTSMVALTGVAISAHDVRANGAFETYGPNARTRGMANAAVATDDTAAAHTNPAAVARVGRAPALSFGYAVDTPALNLELRSPRPADDPLTPAVAPQIAGLTMSMLIPIDLVLRDRLVFGAAFYAPGAVLVRARMHDPQRPWFHAYDSATEHIDASVALGVRITDWLYAGVGARLAGAERGVVSIAMDPVRGRVTRQELDAAVLPSAPLTAGLLVGRLGVEHIVQGSFGLVYREPTSFIIDLPAGLTVEGAGLDALLAIDVAASHSPRSLTAGFSFDVLDVVHLNVEAQGAQWSMAPPPFMRTAIDLGGGGLDSLGLDAGLDAPAAGQERVVAPGFTDTLSVRTGVEAEVLPDTLRLRAGYQYRPTPVPDQTTGGNIVDSNVHVIAVGSGLTLRMPNVLERPLTLDIAYQVHVLQERSVRKASPVDAVGGWTASGSVHSVAVGCSYTF